MGKKSRRKRKKYKYTKTEFVDIICAQCGLCPKGTDPVFCYGDVYKDNPKKFIRVIFKNLMEVKRWLINVGHADPTFCPDEDIEYIFRMGFCQSNYCKQKPPGNRNKCDYLAGCLTAFRKQIKNPTGQVLQLDEYRGRNKKKNRKYKTKKKKQKARYVPQPYPTFFCNEGMQKEVRRIVDGNNPEQQDKGKEST